jgi:hypothetical protein
MCLVDMAKLTKLLGVVDKISSSLQQPDLVKVKVPQIVDLLEDLQDILGDGLQWRDVAPILGKVVPSLMELANSLEGKTGEEKKQFVVDSVWTIYKFYDPDIPWLPEPIESMLEQAVITRLAEAAVEAVYAFGLKKGLW